jgi:hypothetical protein
MVKPPPITPSSAVDRANEQREIRDWHTLVAKLANEAETLRTWTEQPPSDELDTKINGTIDKLAKGLAGDAVRLARAWPEGEEPDPTAGEPAETLPKPAGLGVNVDKSA